MNDLLEHAKSLHLAGRLDEALLMYRRVLDADPTSSAAHNMLGNALFDQGQWQAAAESYRRALTLDERYASAHYNLGNALCASRLWAEAVPCYQRALELDPGRAAAHFNCGNAFNELGRQEEAVACYRRALEVDSDHPDPDTAYNLGQTLHNLGRLDEAIIAYRLAIQVDPLFFRAHSNLALTLFDAGKAAEAIESHQRAMELDPQVVSEYFHLSLAHLGLGDFPAAEQVLRRALELNPGYGSAYELLGRILEMTGRCRELPALAERWMQAVPEDPRAVHMQAAWTGQATPARASEEYVRDVFDRFAPHFDDTLGKLDYQGPQLVSTLIAAYGDPGGHKREILDAGCGTGLCGSLLRPLARRLVGVDLSGRMLDEARRRAVYDELVEGELTAYLRRCTEDFDAVVSADTLIYFGDLDPVFAAAAQALRAGGLLAFTLECLSGDDSGTEFRLNPHGRFCHTEAYVRRALEASGFSVCSFESAVVRKEGGQPVTGYVVLAAKAAALPPTASPG